MHVKKGDTVIVLTGKDAGKKGAIVKAFPKENKVLVDGINMVKKHQKARRRGEKGTTVERAMPIHVSNVKNVEGRVKKSATPKVAKKTTKKSA